MSPENFAALCFAIFCSAMLGCADANPRQSPPSRTQSQKARAPLRTVPKAVEALPFTEVVKVGDVHLTPWSVTIDRPQVEGVLGDYAASESELLVLKVRVVNLSILEDLQFKGWPANPYLPNCRAEDENGTTYHVADFSTAPKLTSDGKNDWKDGNLPPLQTGYATILFDKPNDAAQSLTMTLDGDAVGVVGAKFRWKLARNDWLLGRTQSFVAMGRGSWIEHREPEKFRDEKRRANFWTQIFEQEARTTPKDRLRQLRAVQSNYN